jgi:hypothetical protein
MTPVCDYEDCSAPATHLGARCEMCYGDSEHPGHDYCSDHYWFLRRHADHAGQIWWGDEGPCECQDCNDRLCREDDE